MTGQSTPGSITPRQASALRGGEPPRECARLFRGTRPRKRWRYVAVFSQEISACAALVEIGPARQSFWALHLRGEQEMAGERTRLLPRRGEVELTRGGVGEEPGSMRVHDGGVQLDLLLEEEPGIAVRCPNGRAEVWTRKQAGVRAHGTLSLYGGAPAPVEALAVIDDTCGHHARVTEWRWSAGVGVGADGTPLAWNLVSGVNDPPSGSERTVWVAGEPREAPPVSFSEDLTGIVCEDGSQLRFHTEVQRSRSENLLLVRSDYRAPFGSFSGVLPGGIALASGRGVMEHHRAVW